MFANNHHNNIDAMQGTPRVQEASSGEIDFFVRETRDALTAHPAGGSGIHFVSLSPLEKGFFAGNENGAVDKDKIRELYNLLSLNDEKKILARMNDFVPVINGKKKEQIIKTLPSGLTLPRIAHLQNGHYDYFEELKKQYKFYLSESPRHYIAAHPGEEMNLSLHNENSKPYVLFIIDGIHSLGIGNADVEFLNNDPSSNDVSIGKIKSRIRQLKGEEFLENDELKKWEYPPMLMRLAGHFGNGLFGHARSFPEGTQAILDQKKYLDKGVVKTSGYDIVRELLGLDEQLQPTGSRRILIDMARLSASARNDLYQLIFRRFNKNINPEHPIPVIFTEAAYSGVDYLAEMTKNAHEGLECDSFRMNNYNGNSINLSDEDILEVFRSNGLISLSLEERRMGNEAGGLEKFFSNNSRTQALRLLGRQIAGVISVPFAYNMTAPLKVWDSLNIGSGLTGKGDRLERYRGSYQRRLEGDLEEVLAKLKKEEPMWFGSYKPDALVCKICYQNVSEFVYRNF